MKIEDLRKASELDNQISNMERGVAEMSKPKFKYIAIHNPDPTNPAYRSSLVEYGESGGTFKIELHNLTDEDFIRMKNAIISLVEDKIVESKAELKKLGVE